MTLTDFVDFISANTITDVFIAIEQVRDTPVQHWVRYEGGALFICSDSGTFVLSQPIGRELIEFQMCSMDDWAVSALAESAVPEDTQIAFFKLFEYVCYRNDINDHPTSVVKVTAFYRDSEARGPCGLLLDLSTGGTLGIDALIYGGLLLFFDNQADIFRRNSVNARGLIESVVWDKCLRPMP
ncbi:MAG: hypothetical protein ACO1RA_17345 [Planctomycetaceae bacterium]